MHTIMMYGGLLGASGTEAAFYINTCPQLSMFVWTGEMETSSAPLHIRGMICMRTI
jgi:hypothetical protein